MSETTNGKLPRWVVIYGIAVMFLAPFGFSLVAFFNPEMLPFDIGSGDAVVLYAIRNMAAALVTLFALYRRSASMMLLMFIQRLLTDGPDFLATLAGSESSFPMLVMMIIFFYGPSIWGIRTLWSAKG